MSGRRILIVDDEMDMRFYLATLVETNGYRYVLAKNGTEGMAAARKNPPDLIFLDIMMPREGGIAMYGQLKADPDLARIPVVILSAIAKETFDHYLTMLSARMGPFVAEPDAYLEKPPEAEKILSVITKLMGNAPAAGPPSPVEKRRTDT